jgi:hypothetical protein
MPQYIFTTIPIKFKQSLYQIAQHYSDHVLILDVSNEHYSAYSTLIHKNCITLAHIIHMYPNTTCHIMITTSNPTPVTAVVAIANVVKTSFGPVGLDKMLVDSIGDVTITNDGATILKLLEVEHPAAKVLVQLADLQDQEVGDGTTSVVLLAAEMLKVLTHFVPNLNLLTYIKESK